MAITHTFKGSSSGYGYSAFIENEDLVIRYESPHEGGETYRGSYMNATNYLERVLKHEVPALYNSIEKYYIKHGVKDSSDLKQKLSFDDKTKTILFAVKLYMDNQVLPTCLVRGRTESGVIAKLTPPIPEVLTLQTVSGRVFAIRSDKISAIEFVED